MDDARLAAAIRTLRHRRGWRQADLAARARVPRTDVSLIETGRAGAVRLGRVRDVLGALGGWVDVVPRVARNDLARMTNEAHARMHAAVAELLAGVAGWELAHEVSFSIYGERGVIDILAWHPVTRTLLVIELKTAIVDVNDLLGSMDRRRRLAGQIGRERGWTAGAVGTWVVVLDTRTNRRRLAEHATVLRRAFPLDGRSMRRWLRRPSGAVDGLGFLPLAAISSGTQGFGGRRRVRAARSRSDRPDPPPPMS